MDGPSKKQQPAGSAEERTAVERLPNAELEVLAAHWHKGKATAGEIREHLAHRRPLAHGSVLTLLKRLSAKNLVSREKAPKGKAFVYQATRQPDAICRRILKDLTDRVFGGSRVAMIASLLDTHSPSEDELDELRELLERLRKP